MTIGEVGDVYTKFAENIEFLAGFAEEEDWKYHNTESESDFPILENYINKQLKRNIHL